MRRVVIHIGPHRTGTSSVQRFLAESRESVLAAAGWTYPAGLVWDTSHAELAAATIAPQHREELRPFMDFAVERLNRQLPSVNDPSWRPIVAESIARTRAVDCIYSDEGLSWLRSEGEMEALIELFPDSDISVVAVQREPVSFLDSYRWMARFTAGSFSEDPASIWYVEPDSWLADLSERVEGWRRILGAGSVNVVDYEACMATDGSVLPELCEAMGLGRSIGLARTAAYHDNPRRS